MTLDEALAVLASGAFAPFVGVAESQALEFKREPYRLDSARQRFELAKDAAGLANAAGGVIVIGIETHRPDDASPVDVVREVRELAAGSVDADRYVAIIDRRVFPRIKHLRIEFFTGGENDRGLVAIVVPAQAEVDKYFLVVEPFEEAGPAPGWLVAIPVRSIDRVVSMSVGELHALLNRGLTISARIEEIAADIARLGAAPPSPAAEAPADRLAARLDSRIAELEGPPPQIA